MAPKKMIFVGSLFDFNKPDEVIERLQSSISDFSNSPFVAYDVGRKLFSFEMDQSASPTHTTDAISQLASYIEHNSKDMPAGASSPHLRPLPGMDMADSSCDSTKFQPRFDNVIDHDTDSDAESSVRDQFERDSIYWVPKKGNVDIITDDIVDELAQDMGAFLIPDLIANRVKICSGNVQGALDRLQSIEDMLQLTSLHRNPSASRLNASIIVFPTSRMEGAVKLVKIAESDAAFERVILPTKLQTLITRVRLIEARFKQINTHEFHIPSNLVLEGMKSVPRASNCKLFAGQNVIEIGNTVNAAPRELPKQLTGTPYYRPEATIQSKFMAPTQATRVSDWSHNVDTLAAPDSIAQETKTDAVTTSRRRVVEDSDSDSEIDDCKAVESERNKQQGLPQASTASRNGDRSRSSAALDISTSNKRCGSQHRSESSAHMNTLGQPQSSERHVIGYGQYPRLSAFHLSRSSKTFGCQVDTGPPFAGPCSNSEDGSTSEDCALAVAPSPAEQIAATQTILVDIASADTGDDVPRLSQTKSRSDCQDTQRTPGVPLHTVKSDKQRKLHDSNIVKVNSLDNDENEPVPLITRTTGDGCHTTICDTHRSNLSISPDTKWSNPEPGTDVLIDVTPSTGSPGQVRPPPGFSYPMRTSSIQAGVNLIDSSLEDIQMPAMKPYMVAGMHHASQECPDSNSSSSLSRIWKFTPRPTIRKRDVNLLRQQQVAQMQVKVRQDSRAVPGADEGSERAISPPRIHTNEAADSVKLHQTMSQKTANPGKSRPKIFRATTSSQTETKKEKAERIAKAKADAYGEATSALRPSILKRSTTAGQVKKSKPGQSPNNKSTPERSITREDNLHPTIREQTNKMILELSALFDACRPCSNQIEFEFQLGQALILESGFLKDSFLYKSTELNKIFSVNRIPAMESIFTNILTRNGAEIDQLVDMRGVHDSSRLWTKKSVLRPVIEFEFLCQSKAGVEFLVVMDAQGDYQILRSKITVGKVALFFPGQVWDACANLHGSTVWKTPPSEVQAGVISFMDSVYVPPKSRAVVFFRQPANAAFIVTDVIVRRTSTHDCLTLEREECQIRVSEIKTLIQDTHPTDRGLCRSSEGDDDEMIDTQRVHYEAAIVDKSINRTLAQLNKNIHAKNLDVEALLSFERLYRMIEIVTHVVEEADWMGSMNYGTYRQLLDEAELAQAETNSNLPPHIATQVGPSMKAITNSAIGLGANSRNSRHRSLPSPPEGTSTFTNSAQSHPVPGLRVGETAPLFKQGGQYFRLGLGGARIPVPEADLVSQANRMNDAIMPRDSVSQAGNAERLALRGVGGSSRRQQDIAKPAGFW